MKGKLFGILALFLVGLFAMCGLATAMDASIVKVKVNGDEVYPSQTNYIRDVERGNEFEIRVEVKNTANDTTISNAQIEAELKGIHNEHITDTTDVFDMKAGVTYVKTLTLNLPDRMDQDRYKLRIRLEDRDENTVHENYELEIDTARNKVSIKRVTFSPAEEVKAGRALLSTVRITNLGEKTEEGLLVKISIPELGISASDDIDELKAGDSITSEELYMRIPSEAKPGKYDVRVDVWYDDMDEKVTETYTIDVIEGDEAAGTTEESKTKITVTVPDTLDVQKGAGGAVFPIMITNNGDKDATYTIGVSGVDVFGTYRIDPANVVIVPKGQTKTAYVYVSANEDATIGLHSFAVTLTANDKTESVPLKANVVKSTATDLDGLKRGLEIGLVILVALLVIVGLIIGFNKLKKGENGEEGTQTYY